ncbi:DUF2971 domain-containing protein [Stutzerimonas nitrititolerans]|uniref:DUF2971 domain-containing protein n=1 Tax=Stutzerimonas nitrititolerans TaxID=2482751 RepID=UPI002899723E|nr:DUF2971 domain-containing protein [Stutzerimonas nitrititolerans]
MIKDPLYLYKYLPAQDYSLKVISEGLIKFSSCLELNDPFEALPIVEVGPFHKFKEEVVVRRFSESSDFMFQRYITASLAVHNGNWARSFQDKAGVLCLTRNEKSGLMWSHYASDHKGIVICLAFDRPMTVCGLELFPQVVKYPSKRPAVNFWGPGEVDKWLLTKSCSWQYEEEERVIIPGFPGIHSYDRSVHLHSVILGSRITPEYKAKVNSAVDKAQVDMLRQIPIFEAKLSSSDYSIHILKLNNKRS